MRMRGSIVRASIGLLAFTGSTAAQALTLSVLPSALSVLPGEELVIELVASGLGDHVAPSLSAFDVTMSFDPGLVTGLALELGSGLGELWTEAWAMAEELEGGLAHAWVVSFLSEAELDSRQGASVLLGTVTVRADAPGLADFAITAAQLIDAASPPLGPNELTVDEFVGATVTIIPEPSTALLLATGLAALSLRGGGSRRRGLRQLRSKSWIPALPGGRQSQERPLSPRSGAATAPLAHPPPGLQDDPH